MQNNLPSVPSSVADQGTVRVGAGLKARPAVVPASVADSNKVRIGAGLKHR